MRPHIPAHVDIECPDVRHPELKMYISEPILDSYEYKSVAYVNNALLLVCFLLGNSSASEFCMPTFRNTLSVPSV
jgi:hypothetical protein